MERQAAIDSLTSHIALYHSASHRDLNPNPNPNPRTSILRWLSSLPTAAHRQSAVTVLDHSLLRLLFHMLSSLRRHGHGHFFLLPDLPSRSDPSLPSLCFRRSTGLLSRAALSDSFAHSFSTSILPFSSQDGDKGAPSAPLDSITLSDSLFANVDQFVETMDGISNGRFLRGDVSARDLGSSWVELPWLKDKGYYSVEAFLANRIEVALRLSWLNSQGGKKNKGVKAKEKVIAAAGVAANVFWRKKGCIDWWMGLDPGHRRKMFTAFLGKSAKSLANEIAKGPDFASKNGICSLGTGVEVPERFCPTASQNLPNKPLWNGSVNLFFDAIPRRHILDDSLSMLRVLQEISALSLAYQQGELEIESLFFSKLESFYTVSDCILRKLRRLLMVVSTEYTNLELLGDPKLTTLPNNIEKPKIGPRKGNNKCRGSKKFNDMPHPVKGHIPIGEFVEDSSVKFYCQEKTLHASVSQKTTRINTRLGKDDKNEIPVNNDMENSISLVDCKGHSDRKKNGRKGSKSKITSSKHAENSQLMNKKFALPSVSTENELKKIDELTILSNTHSVSNSTIQRGLPGLSFCSPSNRTDTWEVTDLTKSSHVDRMVPFAADSCVHGSEFFRSSDRSEDGDVLPCPMEIEEDLKAKSQVHVIDTCMDTISGHYSCSPERRSKNTFSCKSICPASPAEELETVIIASEQVHNNSGQTNGTSMHPIAPLKCFQTPRTENANNQMTSMGVTSYEWPSIAPLNFSSVSSTHVPATTDRLHLDVGRKWPSHSHHSFLPSRPQARISSVESAKSCMLSPALPMSFDWPLMVNGCTHLSQRTTVAYDSGCSTGLQSPFCAGFSAHGAQINAASENERKHYGDTVDMYDQKNTPERVDDGESYWWSEEESDSRTFSGRDYNQFFGGGVMYWNPAEHVGTGFSRPPSHSSEDSSWAWREADLSRAIDDIISLPGISASYSTNGLTSPPASTFCSPLEPLAPGHQAVGYAIPGNDGSGNVMHSSISISEASEDITLKSINNSSGIIEGLKGDQLPYQLLRPIIVPGISRKGSRSEFKLAHDHKNSCVPSSRRDLPRIKRPPSPMVLCVPPVPRPPPPSPVGESRKRGFSIVRSGSSSPRHWGVRSWYHEQSNQSNSEETRLCLDGAEVVWPSWGNKGLTATPIMQSIEGSLLQDRLVTISQLAHEQGHPDITLPVQPPELLDPSYKMSMSILFNLLHEEIETYCKQVTAGSSHAKSKVAAKNVMKKPYISWAVKRVTRSLQVLWPRSRTNIFGSNATGLALPSSDVDLVVSLPPVRNLEPIKEAGILEGRNGIKETCLQHAARYLVNQDWVRNDSLKTIENTAIPVIMLVVEVPHDVKFSNGTSRSLPILDKLVSESTNLSGEQVSPCSDFLSSGSAPLPVHSEKRKGTVDVKSIRLDISFKSQSHTGLQTSELVRELTQQFPASIPLSLVLKKFLADRSLDHSYSGGLSSYCLVLLITRFLQHEHHIGRPINQNLGSLLMDFLYFFGNVFDPRQMRISIRGSGIYMNREKGLSIDPIHVDDPLYTANNVGRNCFRIHQCIKAFADAYSVLENELPQLSGDCGTTPTPLFRLLPKIIPSIGCEE